MNVRVHEHARKNASQIHSHTHTNKRTLVQQIVENVSPSDFGIRFLIADFFSVLYQHGHRAGTKTEKKSTIEIEFQNQKGTRFPQSAISPMNIPICNSTRAASSRSEYRTTMFFGKKIEEKNNKLQA
jgi:hypothetical protein